MCNDFNINSTRLQDGKHWDINKKNSLLLSQSYNRLGYVNKAVSVGMCGTVLEFKRFTDNTLKLHQANFCKVRLCPMCAWRRSLKVFAQVSKVMDFVSNDYNFLFLTLTCKNVSGEALSSEIDSLFYAFNKMTKNTVFKKAVKGWFRCLEVTHNLLTDTYHPHFHVVLVVNKSYFKDVKIYLTFNDWVELWKNCLNVDYTPVVDIRAFKDSSRGKGKEVAEVSKYAVKASDFLVKDDSGDIIERDTDNTVFILDTALKNRRLYSFGGVLRDVHKKLNLDDTEDGDMINVSGDELREDLEFIIERYVWNVGYSTYVLDKSE